MSLFNLFSLIILCTITYGERLHEQIYSSIEGGAACFRRLNGTHQAGCSSSDNGNVGVIQMVKDVSDAQWLVNNATAGPYTAVVSTRLFDEVVELFMAQPYNVAGVLIYDNATDRASAFSQESRCPNEYSAGPGSQCSSRSGGGGAVWNEKGTGLLRRDVPFPVFYLPESRADQIVQIEQCYEKFNLERSNQRGKPLCSIQLSSFMFAALNTEVCRRRSASSAILSATKVCDPLGDYNVYYSLFPRKRDKTAKRENVTLVTARIDSASLFDGVSPGAASSVVGMVTVLSAAVTLSRLIPLSDAALYGNVYYGMCIVGMVTVLSAAVTLSRLIPLSDAALYGNVYYGMCIVGMVTVLSAAVTLSRLIPLSDAALYGNVYYGMCIVGMVTVLSAAVTLSRLIPLSDAALYGNVYYGMCIVGMVTVLSAAVTLSRLIPLSDAALYDHNILFTLFNGESFDYIGSQRVAYDLARGAWPPPAPLAPRDIRLHVEVGQVGGALLAHSAHSGWPMHSFAPYARARPVPEIDAFLSEMKRNCNPYNITLNATWAGGDGNLPPSSLHSFRNILGELTVRSAELPELLLADHGETFTNLFYQSALDAADNIGFLYRNITLGPDGSFMTTEELVAEGAMRESDVQVKIARLATALARTLYRRVAGARYEGGATASAHLVDEMLYCFVRSQACRLLLAAERGEAEGSAGAGGAAPLYVGVGAGAGAGAAPVFAGHLLALLAGARPGLGREECAARSDPGFTYFWLKGWNHTGECFQTTMNFSRAVSPAFTMSDYDMSSGAYSTWTESVWAGMWARVFVAAGGGGARAAAGGGAVATLVAALAAAFVSRNHRRLFGPPGSGSVAGAGARIVRTVNC